MQRDVEKFLSNSELLQVDLWGHAVRGPRVQDLLHSDRLLIHRRDQKGVPGHVCL